MNTIELIDAMKALLETVEAEHIKGNKAARGRARKAAGSLKKLANTFQKTSTAEDKA